MEIKKTVAALAITASSAFSLVPPPTASKTICLDLYEGKQGESRLGSCDQARNNQILKKPLLANGCAADQASLVATSWNNKFNINIHACLPPNVVQL